MLATPTESAELPRLQGDERVVFENASWSFYQRVLREIGDSRSLRVNYFEGRMEIVSPLPIHDELARATAQIIWCMTEEWEMESKSFGSSTFSIRERRAGLEPDECFYFKNASRVIGMERFDIAIYPSPDLAVEVEVTKPAVAKLPIYSALNVPEIWRWEQRKLRFFSHFAPAYVPISTSTAFPEITPSQIERWAEALLNTSRQFEVHRQIRQDLRRLRPSR